MTKIPSAVEQRSLNDVHAFWSTEACGSHYVDGPRESKDFFDSYRRFRYSSEWHIPLLVPFAETDGLRVLEIGCGNGADGVLFARAGADYVGTDLTATAVLATQNHFRVAGLNGHFHLANAESLPFRADSFDFVYSYGVLHHTHDPSSALKEIHRVLRKDGQAVIMLYNKTSLNYYLRILGYMRLRVLLTILVRRMQNRAGVAPRSADAPIGVRGNRNGGIWELHYQAFRRWGWSYLKADSFVNHATDGPECPCARVYTKRDVARLFRRFHHVRQKIAHFPIRGLPLVTWLPRRVEGYLASKIGWYRMIYARK